MTEHSSEVEIITLPAFTAGRYQSISREPEDESGSKVREWYAKQKFPGWKPRWFGFDVPVVEELQQKGMRGYESWVTVPAYAKESGEIEIIDFDGGRYASLLISDPFTTPFETIPQGWQKLVNWVKGSEHPFDDRPCLEEIIETPSGPALVLYLAIKE